MYVFWTDGYGNDYECWSIAAFMAGGTSYVVVSHNGHPRILEVDTVTFNEKRLECSASMRSYP